MPYSPKNLTCVECGASFVFTVEDQEYHASRGFQNEPRRCTTCRQARRADSGGGAYASSGGGGGGYSSSPRQMFPAVCAECGQKTEVPFEPRGDKPVYCRDCFSRRAPSRGRY